MNKEQFQKEFSLLIEAKSEYKDAKISREIFDNQVKEVLNSLSKQWDEAIYEDDREEIWEAAYSVLELQGHDSCIIIDALRMSLR